MTTGDYYFWSLTINLSSENQGHKNNQSDDVQKHWDNAHNFDSFDQMYNAATFW